MSNRTLHQLLSALVLIFDASLICTSILVAYWLRFESGWLKVLTIHKGAPPPLDFYFDLMPLKTALWIVTLRRLGLYRVDEGVTLETARTLLKGAIIALIATLAAIFFFYHAHEYSRWIMVLSSGFNIAFLLIGRLAVQRFREAMQQLGIGVNRVALVGFDTTAQRFIQSVKEKKRSGYRFLGIVLGQQPPAMPISDRLLGERTEIRHLVEKYQIDELFIASPAIAHAEILQIIHACEGLSVQINVLPHLYEVMIGRTRLTTFDGIPVVRLKELPLHSWGEAAKRCMDVVLSAVALLVFSPLMLLIAIVVKLTSPGTVIFHQERIGRNGKPFSIYKFRSMCQDAEDGVGHTWASTNDPRQTRIGRFLRRWSLDELPQFVNVLKGEMSLVGPRPEMSDLIDDFSRDIPHYLDRHRVKTGMTGWAQVNGLRGNTSLEERIRYDLYYIENWSLFFDIKIILMTLWAIKDGSKSC